AGTLVDAPGSEGRRATGCAVRAIRGALLAAVLRLSSRHFGAPLAGGVRRGGALHTDAGGRVAVRRRRWLRRRAGRRDVGGLGGAARPGASDLGVDRER